MEAETVDENKEDIPDRCLCELCNRISEYCLNVENLSSGELEFEIFLCKRCCRKTLLTYLTETDSDYLKDSN
ncbi:hypothetical protein MCHI_000990 [Candidatus Magnetoovum chiemensis]|nr:hypothetical protein MCHI_000985 [Candidatus Magnetoovum chiemensis]KJR43117.1 hypothetical protein MCHI_000990 [Candidatus Magnetoovum chiemensis]